MTGSDDLKGKIRRENLFGIWAADNWALRDETVRLISDALAMGMLDHKHSDVFSTIAQLG